MKCRKIDTPIFNHCELLQLFYTTNSYTASKRWQYYCQRNQILKKKERERKVVLWWYEEITVTVNLSVINTDVVCFVKKFHCLEVNIEAFMDEMVVI